MHRRFRVLSCWVHVCLCLCGCASLNVQMPSNAPYNITLIYAFTLKCKQWLLWMVHSILIHIQILFEWMGNSVCIWQYFSVCVKFQWINEIVNSIGIWTYLCQLFFVYEMIIIYYSFCRFDIRCLLFY